MKLYTIIGDPVSHSRSPLMHNHVFQTLKLSACYTRSQLIDGTQLKSYLLKRSFSGANVTVPHKEDAYRLCHEVRGIANDIKAVNTIIIEDGKLIGYNTDADGFLASIHSYKPLKNALIIGAGGTAKALSIVLSKNNITPTILNRSSNRLDFFEQAGFETFTWDTFSLSSFDIVINTTSAGLKDDYLPLSKDILGPLLSNAKVAVDVIYGKKTPFLELCETVSIPYKDGADMLLEQGVLANYLFLDKTFAIEKIRAIMRESFIF